MAQTGSFNISVGLIDNASKGLININKQIAAARRPMDNLQKQMDKFAKLSGISALKKQTTELLNPLERAGKMFAGLFGMSSIAGIIATTRQFAELSNEIQRTSSALGVSVDKLQQLRGAGTLLGTGSNSMGNMLQTIQNNQLSMRFGGDGDLQTIYQKLHLSQRDSATTIRNRTLDYVAQHNRAGDVDPAILRQISQKMLGTTDYMGMDSKQVTAAENRAKFLGRYNADNVKNANQLREAYQGVFIALNGVTQTIIGKLSPTLTPLLNQFANWLASPDGTKMIDSIVDGVKEFVKWLQQVDWKGWGQSIKSATTAIGGFKTIIELLIGLKVVSFLGSIAVTTFKIGAAFTNIVKSGIVSLFEGISKIKFPTTIPDFFEGLLKTLGKVGTALGVVTTAYELFQDSKIKDTQDRHKAYTATVGGLGGSMAGAAAGAAIGSVIPGVGTAIGGVVGGVAGYYGGSALAKKGYDYVMGRKADITTAQQSKNINYLYNQLHKDLPELSSNALYGILGNISQESSFDPRTMGDHGHAHGLLQWQTPRVKDLKQAGFDVTNGSLETNEKAIVYDLRHGASNQAYKAFLANQNASLRETTSIFRTLAERPANKDGMEDQKRFAKAQTVQHIHQLEVNVSDDRTTASVKTNSQSGLKVAVPKIQQKQTKTMGNGLI